MHTSPVRRRWPLAGSAGALAATGTRAGTEPVLRNPAGLREQAATEAGAHLHDARMAREGGRGHLLRARDHEQPLRGDAVSRAHAAARMPGHHLRWTGPALAAARARAHAAAFRHLRNLPRCQRAVQLSARGHEATGSGRPAGGLIRPATPIHARHVARPRGPSAFEATARGALPAYLRSLRFIKSDFVDFLGLFKLNEKYITVTPLPTGELEISIEGPWLHTILFEIPVLAIINEVYFRNTQKVPDFPEGRRRLDAKIALLQGEGLSDLKIADYGTRRRFSRAWHEEVLRVLVARLGTGDRRPGAPAGPGQFAGTSN
eukprot:gene18028-25265_t